MAPPEVYKEFDTSSIVTGKSDATVSIRGHSYRKRELILGFIAFCALLLVIILAIVLAVEMGAMGSKDSNSPMSSAQTAFGAGSGSMSDASVCLTASCLKAALFHTSSIKQDVNPCDDFYQYACGGYAEHNPQTPMMEEVTPQEQILEENIRKLVGLLGPNAERNYRHSYERKLKDFFTSCDDHFIKMDLRGLPFVHYVMNKTGGWWLLDNWNETTFDFEKTLRTVHVELWTTAFFNMITSPDENDWNKKVVEIDIGGMGLDPDFYANGLGYEDIQETYKEYIRYTVGLLIPDAMPIYGHLETMDPVERQNRAFQFAEDAFDIESMMASVHYNSIYKLDPHHNQQKMTLGAVTTLLNNTIDMTVYMKDVFNEWPNKFTPDTKIVVLREYFFENLATVLSHFLYTDPEGPRKLHNYMMWQLLSRYAPDLSWDYVHAKRKLTHLIYGYKESDSGSLNCFFLAETAMSDALNAVFLKQYVKAKDTEEGDRIATNIKNQMIKSLDSFKWMSEVDRRTAKDKITGSLQKIGYADYMASDDQMDKLYVEVNINPTDYFSNVLNLNKMMRKRYNRDIGYQSSRTTWSYHIFTPMVDYYNPWHELVVTAGALQNPLFSSTAPAYYKYGGIGTAMAKSFVHAVDEIGNQFQLDGSNYGNWWSTTTQQKYEEVKQCAIDAQNSQQLGPFRIGAESRSVNASRFSPVYATNLLAEATGLRLAYKAYQQDVTSEKLPPGVDAATQAKMFFLSFAQTKCQNAPDYLKYSHLGLYKFPSDYRVNSVVAQVPEFAAAFSCPASSPYSQKKRCMLFD